MCDNTSVLNLSKTTIQHTRYKNIEIKHHFLRDHVKKKEIELNFVDTINLLDRVFTNHWLIIDLMLLKKNCVL
jgi:hypothetical protein